MFDFIAQAAEPVITGLDVVKTVDAFYQNAWLMLFGMVVLFGSIIGIVMPLIIQRIQSSSFDKTEKRLKDEIEQIKNETQGSIQGEVEALTSKFDEIQKNMEKQIDKRARLNRAEFYSQMATSFTLGGGKKLDTFIFHITSAKELATLKDYGLLTKELDRAISAKGRICVPYPKGLVNKEFQTRLLKQINGIREALVDQGVISKYSEQLGNIEDFYKKLFVTVADEPESPPKETKQA